MQQGSKLHTSGSMIIRKLNGLNWARLAKFNTNYSGRFDADWFGAWNLRKKKVNWFKHWASWPELCPKI